MSFRHYSFFDRLIMGVEHALMHSAFKNYAKNSTHKNYAKNPTNPSYIANHTDKQVEQMIRVDHSGEVCAQALYYGHALVARSFTTQLHMLKAANEEQHHLQWCENYLCKSKGRVSYLNPFWYAGAYSIGVMAGLLGDQYGLGFVMETERQVIEHLNQQLANLPADNSTVRELILKMREDEAHHAQDAKVSGAKELPLPVRWLMRVSAKVMTTTARYV